MRIFFIFLSIILAIVACKPTKKIQTAINTKKPVPVMNKDNKDSTDSAVAEHAKEDSMRFIKDTYHAILANHIDYKTFSAKIDVDYIDADDKKYNVNVFLRMYKD